MSYQQQRIKKAKAINLSTIFSFSMQQFLLPFSLRNFGQSKEHQMHPAEAYIHIKPPRREKCIEPVADNAI